MSTISVEQAQAQLPDLIDRLKPGEEVEITKGNRTVAKLVSGRKPRVFGLGKGKLTILKEDDAYLKDFEQYMP
jgi:antitoxin (DNA-binding transcriptional repressor) of toxin-antitoxin stability system